MYLLTPEGCMTPQKRSFVVSKTSFPNLDTNLPESRLQSRASLHAAMQKSSTSLGKDAEPLSGHQLMERKRERTKFTLNRKRELYPENCPTCGNKHVAVQYFGHRHICASCKVYLKSRDGRLVRVAVDEKGLIIAESTDERKQDPQIDPSDLRIFDRKCYASFAGEDELVVLMFEGTLAY